MKKYLVEWDNVKTEKTKVMIETTSYEDARKVYFGQIDRLKKSSKSTKSNVQINFIEEDDRGKKILENWYE